MITITLHENHVMTLILFIFGYAILRKLIDLWRDVALDDDDAPKRESDVLSSTELAYDERENGSTGFTIKKDERK